LESYMWPAGRVLRTPVGYMNSVVQSVPLKRKLNYFSHEPLHAENDDTNANTEFLQTCIRCWS
jgi:hypothetical protein